MKKFILPAVLTAAAVLATPALAEPIRWTVSGTFADGGTISGSYVYDNDVPGGALSQVNVTTTAGTTLGTGAAYTVQGLVLGSNGLELRTAGGAGDGQRVIYIDIIGSMNNSGGSRTLRTGGGTVEGTCTGGTCGGAYGARRNLTSGSINGVAAGPAPVPTLTEWAMIGLTGLLAMAGATLVMRRREDV